MKTTGEEYKYCPFCGKLIYAKAAICKHCGKTLPNESKPKSRADNIYQKYDPRDIMIGKICTIIFLIAVSYSFLGDVGYRISHLFPKASEIVETPVNPQSECIQENMSAPSHITIGSGRKYRILLKQAKYSLSGIVVAKNTNFWLRGIMQNKFDEVVPIDFGIAFGKIADKKLLKEHFKFKSHKTLGEARQLSERWDSSTPFGFGYIHSHVSHNHIIPATDNVAAVLLKIKKWDNVRLDGYLVDIVYPDGTTSLTSLSRSDTNIESRGANRTGGACEIFYVEGVQLGNKYYR